MLGGEFFDKLVDVSKKWGIIKYPRVLNSVVKMNLASPQRLVIDGFCRYVKPSDMNALTVPNNLPLVAEAEQLIEDC